MNRDTCTFSAAVVLVLFSGKRARSQTEPLALLRTEMCPPATQQQMSGVLSLSPEDNVFAIAICVVLIVFGGVS